MKRILTSPEHQIITRVFRATRKQTGMSQVQAATLLGVDQAALSRMERGRHNILAYHWMVLSNYAKVSADSIRLGYLEQGVPAVLKLDNADNPYVLPRRYSRNRGSKVRAVLPFLNFMKERLGEQYLSDYLKRAKIDSDFFVNLDNQINIEFSLDVFAHLVQSVGLTESDVHRISLPNSRREFHGSISDAYNEYTSIDLIRCLLENIALYECNHEYKIEVDQPGVLEFSVRPHDHLRVERYKHHPVLGRLPCRHRVSYFENFSAFNGGQRIKLEESQCYHGYSDRCVYRITQ